MGAAVLNRGRVRRAGTPPRTGVRGALAVAVVLALLSGIAPAGASEWDTRDDTGSGRVQDSYPYKTADPSQNDPLGFPYRSGASYVAWYLADSGVTVHAEMPGVDGPAPVRFATGPGYGSDDASWTASMWRLGFHVRDDSAARLGDVYVNPDGNWIGVVYEVKNGWITVAGYEVGDQRAADTFGIAQVRVAKGDCACVVDVFNTPIASSQGGVNVTEETVQEKIRTYPSDTAREVSPPAVDAGGTMSGRVSTDGEAFVAYGEGTPGVSFPEGGPFDVADQDPTLPHPYRFVLYNRTFGGGLAYLPGQGAPGANGGTDNGLAMSPNLDRMAWSTRDALLPEDTCPDGSPLAETIYDGQGFATTLSHLGIFYGSIFVVGAGGMHVNAEPRLNGHTSPDWWGSGDTIMLCVGEKVVSPRDVYVTDLRTGRSFIATPPQLNSDPASGQESSLSGLGVVSDSGVVEVSATVRASYGYPDDNPNAYLPSPLPERAGRAINILVGGASGWMENWALNVTWWVFTYIASVQETLDEISVDMWATWPTPLGGADCDMVEFLIWRCTGSVDFWARNKGPWRSVAGTYDVTAPAGTWNELPDQARYVVVTPATGDVRPAPTADDSLGVYPNNSPENLTPNGRWWHRAWWNDAWNDGSGVCLESVQSGERYDCRPMMDGGPVGDGPVGPNDDGEFLATYSTPGGDYVTVWRPGSSGKLEMASAVLLPTVSDGGGTWEVCHLGGVSMKTPEGRRTLATYCRGSQRRFAIIEVPDQRAGRDATSLAGGSGVTRGQGVVAGGGRWEVGTRVATEHGGELQGSRQGLMGVAVKRDTGDAVPTGAAFYELSSPSRRWRVLGRKFDELSVDTARQAYRLERPGSAAVLRGPCDVYSLPNTGGKQPFLTDPPVDRRGTYCTWTFTEGSPSGHGGGDAQFSLEVRRANGGPVVLDVPRTAVPLGPSNQLLVDAAGYDKPLSALGRRLERAAKNLAAGLVDDLADDVAGVEVEYEVQEMMARLDPWIDHQLAELKGVALEWVDQIPPWLEKHVFTPLVEMVTRFVNRWGLNFQAVKDDVKGFFEQPLQVLEDFCAGVVATGGDLGDALTAMFDNPYLSAGMGAAGFDVNDQAVLTGLVEGFTGEIQDICGTLGEEARQALEDAISQYVDGPLDLLATRFEDAKTVVTGQMEARVNDLRALVNGAIDSLRAEIVAFDLTPLKDVPIDISSCPTHGEPGYDPNCRIDLVRDWARQILKGAHDWVLDLVYEDDPNYDYHNPSGCDSSGTRLLKIVHCAVDWAHAVWTEGFTAQLQPLDEAIQGVAAGIAGITTNDDYDQLFHCAAGLTSALDLLSTSWWEAVLEPVISLLSGGWLNWFSGAERDDPALLQHAVECILPTPGGWWPNDADWLTLGPWTTEQVSRFFYAALDFVSNVLADQLSRVTVDGGDVNAVGQAVVQLLVNLTKKTITLDGQPLPDNYFEALEEKLSGGADDVSWEQIWGFLTDGVDGFTGAGMSDWESIQSGMRCAEVTYNPNWWYDHAPDAVKNAFDLALFLEGCKKGGFVQGTLRYLLEDPAQFLGQPLEARFEYLWTNPKGIGSHLHRLLDVVERRLVSYVQSILPDKLRELGGWIRSAGTDRQGEIETALRYELELLMDLLQGEAGAANPVEEAVNGAANRVAGALDRLAWAIEVQAAQPWLREVAQLIRWANVRLSQAVAAVATVVQTVRDWIAGLGLPAELEAAIFGLLDDIMDAVTGAAEWVENNALEPMETQLDTLLRMAFGSIAAAIRAQKASVYDLRDSLIGKFRAWLVEWADKVARSCGEGHAKLPGEPSGVCDIVTEPVDTVFDAGVNWIAGAIEDIADVIEGRVSGAPRTIRKYVDELNCELVLYVYDIQAQVEGMCERINAGLPPFEVKKSSESLLNLLTSKGEELQKWILDELANASRAIRGFDLESEEMWAQMDATVASGMQFAMFAVDPEVREALGEYLRHALSRVARWVEPMSDEQALRAVGEDLGLPDLYRVIQDQIAEVVPFIRAQVYDILGNLPNVDGLAFDLRAATSLADVVSSFGTFGDYLLTWVIETVDDVTGNFLNLNAKVAGAIGDSVLRVAENTLRVVIDGIVNVFRFVVWAHEYTFEKVMTPLIALGEVPDVWGAPGFGEVEADATFAGDVRLDMRFAQDHATAPVGGAVAAYPRVSHPGEWYVVSSSSFQAGTFTQPDRTLEELDGNAGTLDVTGFCNVYRASGPNLSDATALVSSGDCQWVVDGFDHDLRLDGPLPEWAGGETALVSGTEVVTLGRPSLLGPLWARLMAQWVAGAEDVVAVVADEDTAGDGTLPELVSATASGGVGAAASDQVGGVSPDGRYVAFSSSAGNLVAGDGNGECDVFLRDRGTGATTAVSTTPGGTTASGCSYLPATSRDGNVVAFTSWAPDLVAGDGNPERDVFVRDLASGATERVSVPAGGGEADAWSFEPVLSGDGRYVAFVSPAGNLVAGDTNGAPDAFVVDRATGTIERVSVAPDGGELPGGIWWGAPVDPFPWGTSIGMSDDANRVVFSVDGAVYVRDRGAGTTQRVDVNDDGDASDGASVRPTISGNGRYVVFASDAGNLSGNGEAPDTNGFVDMFRRDLTEGRTRIVSRSAAGQSDGTSGDSTPAAAMGVDGRWVVFESTATNLAAVPGNGQRQVYARDMDSADVRLLSLTAGGAPGGAGSGGIRIGEDNTVAFVSEAADLAGGDANGVTDVFVSDVLASGGPSWLLEDLVRWVERVGEGYFADPAGRPAHDATERWVEDNLGIRGRFSPELVSATATGGAGGAASHQVGGVSPDGRYVVFSSEAEDLVAGDGNAKRDVFVRDRFARTTAALSTTPGGATGGGHSARPAMSRDGTAVTFASSAPDLVAGDTNAETDIFVRDLASGAMERVNVPAAGGESDGVSTEPVVSGDGRHVAFLSVAGNLVAGDTNSAFDVFVADRAVGTLERVSVADDGSELPLGASYAAPVPGLPWGTSIGISDDGARVVFTDTRGGVFVRDRGLGTTLRADVNDAGDPASTYAGERPAISGDGRYVVFATAADNLAGGDDPPDGNGLLDVYRHDLERGRTRRVSRPASAGAGESDGASGEWIPAAAQSGGGRGVVFESPATNLADGVGSGERQLYVRDMDSESVRVLTVTSAGLPGDAGSGGARIGGDFAVAFTSEASNFADADANGAWDVYVSDALVPFETWLQTRLLWWLEGKDAYLADLEVRRAREDARQQLIGDLADSTFEAVAAYLGLGSDTGAGAGPALVNATPWGAVENGGRGEIHDRSRVSADGRYVVFSSAAADLVVDDGNDAEDVFRRDTQTGVTVRVSENRAAGTESVRGKASRFPAVSGDGRYVAYRSQATNLTAGGAPPVVESGVLIWDAETGANALVPGSEGATGDAAVSADGRYVVYGREGSGDDGSALWVYRYDRGTDTTAVANVPVSGVVPDYESSSFDVSEDGRYVLFVSLATNLYEGDNSDYAVDALVRDMDAGVTFRAGRGVLYDAALSGDGHYVVFSSATALVAEDTNNGSDVYRYDVVSGTTSLMSVSDGIPVAATGGYRPAISDDGRVVVFLSGTGVYVRDTVAGVTRLVSVAADGRVLPGTAVLDPVLELGVEPTAVSGDGQWVAFPWHDAATGSAKNFLYHATTDPPPPPELSVQGATDALSTFLTTWLGERSAEERAAIEPDAQRLLDRLVVFLTPWSGGGPVADPRLLSVSAEGVPGDWGATEAQAAPDGTAAVFTSLAGNLVPGDSGGRFDVFVSGTATAAIERVSVASDGSEADSHSSTGSASFAADRVAFASYATNLVAGDTNSRRDVFVRDRVDGTTRRVSVASDGAQADAASHDPEIGADGRYVVFSSDATNLVAGDTNGVRDVFLHDLDTGATERVSVDGAGTQGNGISGGTDSGNVDLSADGRYVAFTSAATNLVAGDTNGVGDAFVRDRVAGATERVSVATDGAQADGGVFTLSGGGSVLSLDGYGDYVAFLSDATNLVAGDTNGVRDAFVRDRVTGTTSRMSVGSDGTQADAQSLSVSVDHDHDYVGFVTRAALGDVRDTNGVQDAFVRDLSGPDTHRVGIGAGGTEPNAGTVSVSLARDTAVIASSSTNLLAAPSPSYSGAQVFFVTTLPRAVEVPSDVAAYVSGALDVIAQWATDALADAPPDPNLVRSLVAVVRELLARQESADGIDWLQRQAAGERMVSDFLGDLADIWGGGGPGSADAVLDALERVRGWLGESPPGLEAAYYVGAVTLGTPVAEGVDAGVDFDWGAGGPAGLTDGFSASWRGRIVPPVTGPVGLTVDSDDGARLWVDGRLVVEDRSTPGSGSASAVVDLVAGVPVPLRLEYREDTGPAGVRLSWRLPGEATAVVVPSTALLAGEPRVGDLPRTISGLERFGDTAAVVTGRANTDVVRGVGDPADTFTALLVATEPYDDPQGSLAYTYRDESAQVTVATTALDTVAATGSSVTVTGSCVRLRVPVAMGPLAPPVKEGPFPCSWRAYEDAGTTRLDVSGAGVSGAAVLADWRLTVKYST